MVSRTTQQFLYPSRVEQYVFIIGCICMSSRSDVKADTITLDDFLTLNPEVSSVILQYLPVVRPSCSVLMFPWIGQCKLHKLMGGVSWLVLSGHATASHWFLCIGITIAVRIQWKYVSLWDNIDVLPTVAPFPPLIATAAAPTITANATSFTFYSSALPTPVSTADSIVSYPSVIPLPVSHAS